MKIILASASPRRKELMSRIREDFIIEPSRFDETLPDDIGPEFAPIYLAAGKANDVARRHKRDLVIGADTIVICGPKILGKPKDRAEAKRMLELLSGFTHKVITGCCLMLKGESVSFSVESYVTFYNLTDEEIEAYLDTGEPMDKAGAYAIQGKGAFLIKDIEGDYYSIIGLPIARLKREIDDLLKDY